MAKSNAMKRLERLLDNEEYGPKLVRISKASRADEARVLDLVDRNVHYTKVHREIDRLDEQRRTRIRERKSGKKTAPVVSRDELRRRAERNLLRQVGGREKADRRIIARNVRLMDLDDLNTAAAATDTEIETRAKLPEYLDTDYGVINPFWYH